MTHTDELNEDMAEDAEVVHGEWRGDTGELAIASRQALLALIKGPYLSGRQKPALWTALRNDERIIRSRLHDLFLDLVIDTVAEVAFVRNVDAGDIDTPRTVRSEKLSFLDTAMLLVLRELLLTRESEGRVIVGQDEVYERLRVYRPDDHDDQLFTSRLNSSWATMKNRLRVLHQAGSGDEERAEISPVLRLIVDADQVRQIEAEYRRVAAGGAGAASDAEGLLPDASEEGTA